MAEIRYYVAAGGAAPFADWFAELDAVVGAKITRAIARMEQGNFSNVKSVGEGVLEYKIDFGPGWRHHRDFADGWNEEAAATGYRGSAWLLAGLQKS
jgi:hypothetical protein